MKKKLDKNQKELLRVQTRRLSRMIDLKNKLAMRLPRDEFRATFSFSPTELGKEVLPSKESIEKLGLKRASERLRIEDHYVTVSVRAKGEPTKENLSSIRQETLEKLILQQKTKEINPNIIPNPDIEELISDISSDFLEEPNEINQTTD